MLTLSHYYWKMLNFYFSLESVKQKNDASKKHKRKYQKTKYETKGIIKNVVL